MIVLISVVLKETSGHPDASSFRNLLECNTLSYCQRFYSFFLDDSGPEEEQSSSSGDEQTEPEADQVSIKGKFAKKLRLKLSSERFLESYSWKILPVQPVAFIKAINYLSGVLLYK